MVSVPTKVLNRHSLRDIFAFHLAQNLHLQLNVFNLIFCCFQVDDLDSNWLCCPSVIAIEV